MHASLCHRRLRRLDRAEQVVAHGLARYPKARGLLREAAEIAMARSDWPAAAERWTLYAERCLKAGNRAGAEPAFPVRGRAGDWFARAWSAVVDQLASSTWPEEAPRAGFVCMVARTLLAADLDEDALRVLERGVDAFADDSELQYLHAIAQLGRGLEPTQLAPEVGEAVVALFSLPHLEHDPGTGLGPIRVVRVPARSSLELALRAGYYVDRRYLRRRVREVSTRDAWPEATSETNLLLARAHETAKKFASTCAEPPHLPEETLADAVYDTIQKELAFQLPMARLAKDIAAMAGADPVAIEIPTTEFAYLGGYTAGEFDLIYLYFELLAIGCNAFLCELTDAVDAESAGMDRTFRFPPGWHTSIPKIPVRDNDRHSDVGLVPAGIRSVAWVAAQLPGASILQTGRVIKEFAYDRSIRQGQPVRADVRLYPEDSLLPTFTFDLRPHAPLRGHDLTTPRRTPVHGEVLVSDAVGGTWLEWLRRATIPLLRHLAIKAQEEVEVHGLREAHVADHFYPEGIIVGDAVRRAGGSVVLHPHSSNPVHVTMRRPESFTTVHAVTRTGAGIWRAAFPDKEVRHTTEGMLGASAAHAYLAGAPVSVVLFGGRPMLGHLPILDLNAHEALYRSFFEHVEALQENHRVSLYFKPRGLSGEHEDWLHQVVGRTATWEPVYEHPLRLELPNMVYSSVSMGTSALIEGLGRGIPGLIVREFPVRDYTTLDAETFPIVSAVTAAELIASCATEAGYLDLAQRELSHYREELGLKD
ncbi:hypothetical protein [Nocardioides limicola]|uniref:hypothetical protein n=1 Tax=Nocardioides limicola TaxID=2803368 RepID=UPI00193B6F48|nr:hypothetical protein [Nocardioides sp. DJM-14]